LIPTTKTCKLTNAYIFLIQNYHNAPLYNH
jgi:hypothetical protein